jgi:hypothetical protein
VYGCLCDKDHVPAEVGDDDATDSEIQDILCISVDEFHTPSPFVRKRVTPDDGATPPPKSIAQEIMLCLFQTNRTNICC